jgi:hypothetical protein
MSKFQCCGPGPELEEWVNILWGSTNVTARVRQGRETILRPKGGLNTLNPLLLPDRLGILICPHPPKTLRIYIDLKNGSEKGWKIGNPEKNWRITCVHTSPVAQLGLFGLFSDTLIVVASLYIITTWWIIERRVSAAVTRACAYVACVYKFL